MIRDALLSLVAPRPHLTQVDPRGVTLYGDSIMHGGIARYLAALMPDATIVDRSLPGDTARDAWRRMPFETRTAAWVVLQLGTNDVTGGRDPVPFLERMVDRLQAEGRVVVLTGLTRRADGLHEPVNSRIAAMAARRLLPWAGWGAIQLDAPDGLHPSDTMARVLAVELRGAITWQQS